MQGQCNYVVYPCITLGCETVQKFPGLQSGQLGDSELIHTNLGTFAACCTDVHYSDLHAKLLHGQENGAPIGHYGGYTGNSKTSRKRHIKSVIELNPGHDNK